MKKFGFYICQINHKAIVYSTHMSFDEYEERISALCEDDYYLQVSNHITIDVSENILSSKLYRKQQTAINEALKELKRLLKREYKILKHLQKNPLESYLFVTIKN